MAPIDDSLSGAVALAAAGDETAFARIIRAYHDDGGSDNAIVISCSSMGPDPVPEAVQTVVWEHRLLEAITYTRAQADIAQR